MASEFPPNSDRSKQAPEEKKVERVTSGEPVVRKKGLGKQFKSVFIGGNAKTASREMIENVLVPSAKEMLVEAGQRWIATLITGNAGTRKGPARPQGPTGYVSYNRFSVSDRPPAANTHRGPTRAARARHDFDDILLESRTEAEEVVERLFDLVERYSSASVADLYQLVGLRSTHTDHKWGWEELRGAGVSKVRGGYLLDLPDPEPLD